MNQTISRFEEQRLRDFEPPVLTAVCSYCKRVRTAAGQWFRGESLEETETLTHSACPSCYGVAVIALLEEIREELAITKEPMSTKDHELL